MSNTTTTTAPLTSTTPGEPAHFGVTEGDEVGLVLGLLITFLLVLVVNLWFLIRVRAGDVMYRHTPDGGEEEVASTVRRVYVWASRALQFVVAVAVLALVTSDDISSPCFFGFDQNQAPDEPACEFATTLGALTIIAALLSMAAAFVWLHQHIPHSILTLDFAINCVMTLLWFTLGAYLAAHLMRRVDRCETEVCADDRAYAKAIAIVCLAFLLSLAYAGCVPDACQMYGWRMRDGEAWTARSTAVFWRLVEMIVPNLIVLATSGPSSVREKGFCWFGRTSCADDVDGDISVCNLALAVSATSILVHILYLIHTYNMDESTKPVLEFVLAPFMAAFWIVAAGVLSTYHAYTCEEFFPTTGDCRRSSGYPEATTAVVFAWLSALSSLFYALYILSRDYLATVLAWRITSGDARVRRLGTLFVVSAMGLIVFALVTRQRDDDPDALCYFGRDGCGEDLKAACSLAQGYGVIVCAMAALSIYFVLAEDNSDPSSVWPVLSPLMLYFSLAVAVVLATSSARTSARTDQREIEGFKISSVALVFVWAISAIWFLFLLDAGLDWLRVLASLDLEGDPAIPPHDAELQARPTTTSLLTHANVVQQQQQQLSQAEFPAKASVRTVTDGLFVDIATVADSFMVGENAREFRAILQRVFAMAVTEHVNAQIGLAADASADTTCAERKQSGPPAWRDGVMCELCSVRFSALQRKHHCRGCGALACAKCTAGRQAVPQYGFYSPVRVCTNCRERRLVT
eukprot:m.118876 g.118876  ORF g.118876 m.118876 type:complete len:746 (+) comp19524_c2_seq1:155-2392(+)